MSEQATSLIPTALVPSGVKDDRQHALAQLFGEALAKIDLSALIMSDPMTVDARLLPFMIREFGATEFIDPDLPELVQRRILASIWELKSLHGYDAGVKLGLKLLGMTAVIEHWWQVEPKRTANTHDLIFYIGEQLFPNDQLFFGEREKALALRMIDLTKRQSQESTIYIGVAMRPRPIRTAQRLSGMRYCKARMRVRQMSPRLPLSETQTTRLSVTSVLRGRAHVGQRPPRPSLTTGLSQTTRALSVKRLRLGQPGGS